MDRKINNNMINRMLIIFKIFMTHRNEKNRKNQNKNT